MSQNVSAHEGKTNRHKLYEVVFTKNVLPLDIRTSGSVHVKKPLVENGKRTNTQD